MSIPIQLSQQCVVAAKRQTGAVLTLSFAFLCTIYESLYFEVAVWLNFIYLVKNTPL